jgi:hypothetical protein
VGFPSGPRDEARNKIEEGRFINSVSQGLADSVAIWGKAFRQENT